MLLASAVPARVGVVSLLLRPLATVPVCGAASSVIELIVGAAGAAVSIMTERPPEAVPVLPAASVALAVIVWLPEDSADVAMLQLPLPSAVPLPTWLAPSNSVTVLFASAVPVKVGVATLVRLSVPDEPESEAVARSGVEGAAGAAVSMVTDRPPEAVPVLPAASVALAVIVWLPEASVDVAMLQLPLPSAVPLPTWVAPSNSVTVLPASAVPVKVGVATLVRLSVPEEPESEAVARSGAEGAPGAAVS